MVDDFEDNAMIAAMQGRLANPNLLNVDRRKLASACAQDAEALADQRDKQRALSFTAKEVLSRNGNGHVR